MFYWKNLKIKKIKLENRFKNPLNSVGKIFFEFPDSSQKCHPHLHHPQQFPFDGKRRFSNGFQHTNNGSPKLGQKTVQALQDPHDLQRAAELAAQGLQAVYAPDCEPKAFAILVRGNGQKINKFNKVEKNKFLPYVVEKEKWLK